MTTTIKRIGSRTMYLPNFRGTSGWYVACQQEPHGEIALFPQVFATQAEAEAMRHQAMVRYCNDLESMWPITIRMSFPDTATKQ